METSTLQRQPIDAGVSHRDPAEALRQQAIVAVVHNWRGREDIPYLHLGIQEPGFDCSSHLGVVILRLTSTVVGHDVDRATRPRTAITRVEFETEHGECINAESNGPLGEARLELANDAVSPFLGIAVARPARLPFTEFTIEVEIAVQNGEVAALDETFWLLISGHSGLSDTDAQGNQ